MEGFEYETAIKDGMSGPAREEARSLKGLQAEIRATEKAILGLRAEQLKYRAAAVDGSSALKKVLSAEASAVGLEIAKLRLPLGGMKSDLRDLKAQEGKGFFASFNDSIFPSIVAGEVAAHVILGIGSAIVGVAEDIGRLGFETAQYVIDVADFRRNAENSYEVLLGTKEQGEKAFQQFEDLGMAIHAPIERAERIGQDLLLQGEKNVRTVRSVIQAVTDLQRVGLEQGATQLQSIINRSLTTGVLTLPRRVSGLGIQLPEFYQALALRLHTSVDNIKTEIKKGKIDAEVGIEELTKAITGGKVGEIALSKLGIGDALTDIRNAFRATFENVNTEPIVQGLKNFKHLLIEITGGAEGFGGDVKSFADEIASFIGEMENRVVIYGQNLEIAFLKAKIAGRDFFDPTGAKSFEDAVRGGLDDVETMAGMMWDIAKAVGAIVGSFLDAAHWIADHTTIPLVHLFEERKAREEAGANAPFDNGVPSGGPSAEDVEREQAHAAGGVVQPADGEMFASVAPGETIVPAGSINIPDMSHVGGAFVGGQGGATVHVDFGAVQVHAPLGAHVTKEELQELTEHAMDDLLERLVIELGG